MRVTGTVVGNTLVVDSDLLLPEGSRVEGDLQVLEAGAGIEVDAETVKELELAHQEADAGEFVTEEDVLATLAGKRQT